MPFRIRQDPENPCIMQQSFDNGDSWSDAFDYSLCESPADRISNEIYITNVIDSFNEIINVYDGTPESIDPILEYGDANDSHRDASLCTALYIYFRYLGELSAEIHRQDLQSASDIHSQFGDIATFVGTVLTGLSWAGRIGSFLPYIGVSSLIAGFLAELLSLAEDIGADLVEWDNDALAWALACCVAPQLEGTTITDVSFRFSISECFNEADGDVYLLRLLVEIFSDKTEPYLAFLKIWSQLIHDTVAGVELPCDCPVCETFSFEGATLPANTSAGSTASFTANTGIRGNDFSTDNSTAIWTSPIGAVDFNEISYTFESSEAVNQTRIVQVRLAGEVVFSDTFDPGSGISEGRMSFTWNVDVVGDEVRVSIEPGQDAHPNWIYGMEVCYSI